MFSGLRRLTVEDGGVGQGGASGAQENLSSPGGIGALPGPVHPPQPEAAVDHLPRWQVVRQDAPGEPTAQDVPHGVDKRSVLMAGWPATRLDRWNEGGKDRPFGIGQIRVVSGTGHGETPAGERWPQQHPIRPTSVPFQTLH